MMPLNQAPNYAPPPGPPLQRQYYTSNMATYNRHHPPQSSSYPQAGPAMVTHSYAYARSPHATAMQSNQHHHLPPPTWHGEPGSVQQLSALTRQPQAAPRSVSRPHSVQYPVLPPQAYGTGSSRTIPCPSQPTAQDVIEISDSEDERTAPPEQRPGIQRQKSGYSGNDRVRFQEMRAGWAGSRTGTPSVQNDSSSAVPSTSAVSSRLTRRSTLDSAISAADAALSEGRVESGSKGQGKGKGVKKVAAQQSRSTSVSQDTAPILGQPAPKKPAAAKPRAPRKTAKSRTTPALPQLPTDVAPASQHAAASSANIKHTTSKPTTTSTENVPSFKQPSHLDVDLSLPMLPSGSGPAIGRNVTVPHAFAVPAPSFTRKRRASTDAGDKSEPVKRARNENVVPSLLPVAPVPASPTKIQSEEADSDSEDLFDGWADEEEDDLFASMERLPASSATPVAPVASVRAKAPMPAGDYENNNSTIGDSTPVEEEFVTAGDPGYFLPFDDSGLADGLVSSLFPLKPTALELAPLC